MEITNRALVMLAAFLTASCGEYLRSQGRAPTQVVIVSLLGARGNTPDQFGSPLVSDVETVVTTPAACSVLSPCVTYVNDLGQVTMSLVLKDPGTTGSVAPSALNQVTFTRYRVAYRRGDGNPEVPAPIESAITFTVPAEGEATMTFQLVRHLAKLEAPLRALRDSGLIITMVADVTFYGRDQAGHELAATGSIGIDFGNFVP